VEEEAGLTHCQLGNLSSARCSIMHACVCVCVCARERERARERESERESEIYCEYIQICKEVPVSLY